METCNLMSLANKSTNKQVFVQDRRPRRPLYAKTFRTFFQDLLVMYQSIAIFTSNYECHTENNEKGW
jgi:hypothetical protein